MLEYYIRERRDLNHEGVTIKTPEVRSRGRVDLQTLAGIVHKQFHFIPKAELQGIAEEFIAEMGNLLAEGYSVSLGKLGCFSVRIGEKNDDDCKDNVVEGDSQEAKPRRRNSRSMKVTKLRFAPNKEFIKGLGAKCKLVSEGPGIRTLQQSPYSREERIQRAVAYLQEHYVMRLNDYVSLTQLSRTTASKELREFHYDRNVPIRSNGSGSGKVWVLDVQQTGGADPD